MYSSTPVDFRTKLLAPLSKQPNMSAGKPDDVNTTTGQFLVLWLDRTRLSTSCPFSRGILRSSNIKLGRSDSGSRKNSTACWPSIANSTRHGNLILLRALSASSRSLSSSSTTRISGGEILLFKVAFKLAPYPSHLKVTTEFRIMTHFNVFLQGMRR